jgi:signal peptidase I
LRRRNSTAAPPAPVGRGRAALSAVTEVVVVLAMALVLSFVIKTFLVQAFFIPSESMYTTLLKGDRVLVSKLTPGPFSLDRGDVVVFKDPGGWLPAETPPVDSALKGAVRGTLTFIGLLPTDSGEHLIKRVIGVPGDTVACCDATGKVTVNGVAIDETPYLDVGDQPSTLTFKVTVPAGNLWVMGDHRSVSEDSRRHQELRGGFVPIDDVVGKAFVIVWPFDRVGGISTPDTVFARVPDRPASR